MPISTTFFADLVRETSNATGAGAFVLSGALPGHRRFADAVPLGTDFCYAIAGITTPAEWEVGTGQIDAQGRLVRASVSASSAAGALVPFTAGLKSVALTATANWYATVALKGEPINDTTIGQTVPSSIKATTLTVGNNGTVFGNNDIRVEGVGASYPSFSMSSSDTNQTAAFFIHPDGSLAFRAVTWGALYFDTYNGNFQVRGSGTGFNTLLDFNAAALRAGNDNARTLGTAAFRWSTIYLGSSPVVTSDERDKVWHGGLNALEIVAALEIAASIGLYQWRDAVEVKGADARAGGARLHVGVKAQQVWRIMAKHGLVEPIKRQGRRGGRPGKTPYAFLCWDEWRDERDRRRRGNRYGVRADQLTLFVVAALASKMASIA